MLKRKPLTLVEIDLPYCTRTFGVGLCAASLDTLQTRTNLVLQSETFDNAYWTKSNASVAGGEADPYDGTAAFKLFPNAVNTGHRLTSTAISFTSGDTYVFSVFLKKGVNLQAAIQLGFGGTPFPTGANHRLTVDLDAGSIAVQGSSIIDAAVEDCGGGWWRVWASATAAATNTDTVSVFLASGTSTSFAGTITDYVFAFGAQVEEGAGPSRYKATVAATVSGFHGGAARKCFNSRFTCEDPANYDAGTKVVTFTHNQDGVPDIPGIFPALKSVSSRPAEINLSGFDPKSNALGVRARVTVALQDFTNNDTWLDKYQAERVSGAALASGVGYNPLTRGKFLSRLVQRFPYYLGIPLRVKRGYVGDNPATMPTENYVMSEFTGPNAGGDLSFTAKDVLDLADNKKAVYPRASNGKLLAAMTDADTTATLTPEDIGDEYAASGLVCIGREVMAFTRVGDVLTLTRGQEGTTAQSHNALDLVQVCGVLDGMTFNTAIETILTDNQPEFVPFIDSAAWQAEHDTWLAGTTTGRVIMPKPTGKAMLIGEICQLGVLVWWDAVSQEIRYMVNAPLGPGETLYPVTDTTGLIEGTPEIDRAEELRASAVWIYHGVRDWTDEALASRNFNKLAIASVAENLYGQEAYKEIFTRWFGRTGDEASAGIIAERLLARYKNVPRVISGILDVKDRAQISIGTRIAVESYVLEDVDGANLAVPMQVNYAEYTDDRVKFRAEEYRLDGRFAFWMDSGTAPADYASATDSEKATGAFWGDDTLTEFTDGDPFYQWF